LKTTLTGAFMADLTLMELLKKYGSDDKARTFLEDIRWPNGAICPRCKTQQDHKITAQKESEHGARKGVYFCSKCRKQFTVTVNTIMESSHIPLGTWLAAMFLICASKKAISSMQLQRMLGITYKSAWFLSHRIRHAMDNNANEPLLSGIVEADEAYVGGKPRKWGKKSKRGRGTNKTPVVVLVERDGRAKTKVMPDVNRKNLRSMLVQNVNIDSKIMTDESNLYNTVGVYFKGGHESVNHSKNLQEATFITILRNLSSLY
jgi:transposase-like protein